MKQLFKGQPGIAGVLVVVLVVLGVIVVAVVAAGAVLLTNPLEITLTNQTTNTLDIAQGSAALNLNFLPNINIPSQIAPGQTATIQVPRRFVTSATIYSGSATIVAFSSTFSFGFSIDMARSTLDGQPLSSQVGRPIDLTRNHTLVLVK